MSRAAVLVLIVLAFGALGWFVWRELGGREEAPAVPEPEARPSSPATVPSPEPIAVPRTPPGAPPGMVWIPAGRAVVGTPFLELGELLENRDPTVVELFFFEGPEHAVDLPAYAIGRMEVSNAQWLRYLEDAHDASYDTTAGELVNLGEVVGDLVNAPRERWGRNTVAEWQLFGGNLDALVEAMPDQVVRNGGEGVDLVGTFQRMRRALLPPGLVLRFYDMLPPQHWPSTRPAEHEMDHPVRWISYNEAEAFTEWAGLRLPTEQEWERAARGVYAQRYPWGDEWPASEADVEQRANVNGLYVDERGRPTTLPVESLPAGASPDGCLHMIGNVQEWTASWFDTYPDTPREHEFMGKYAKILRGGAADEDERLALRPAARNWKAEAPDAPPRPENRFPFTGFRTAFEPEPGRNRLEPVLHRALRGRYFQRDRVAIDRFAGAATHHFVPDEASAEDHAYVLGRSRAFLLLPLTTVLEEDERPPRGRALPDLAKAVDSHKDPVPLAVFHTDVGLTKVFVRDLTADPTQDRGRRRREAELRLIEGTAPAGTYLLCLWQHRLALADPTLEVVGFLGPGWIGSNEDALRVDDVQGDLPETRVQVDAAADTVTLTFALPVGGGRPRQGWTLLAEGLVLHTPPGALAAAGTWRQTAAD